MLHTIPAPAYSGMERIVFSRFRNCSQGIPITGADLTIHGGEPIPQSAYGVNALGDGRYTYQFDPDGTWTVSASSGPGSAAPERASLLQLLVGLGAVALLYASCKKTKNARESRAKPASAGAPYTETRCPSRYSTAASSNSSNG